MFERGWQLIAYINYNSVEGLFLIYDTLQKPPG